MDETTCLTKSSIVARPSPQSLLQQAVSSHIQNTETKSLNVELNASVMSVQFRTAAVKHVLVHLSLFIPRTIIWFNNLQSVGR
jgi:hypothetical protein